MSITCTVVYAGRCHIPDVHVLIFPDQSVLTGPGYQRERSPASGYKTRHPRDRMDGHSIHPVDRERGLRPCRLRYSTHGLMQKQVMATIASTIPIVSVAKALAADTMCRYPHPKRLDRGKKRRRGHILEALATCAPVHADRQHNSRVILSYCNLAPQTGRLR